MALPQGALRFANLAAHAAENCDGVQIPKNILDVLYRNRRTPMPRDVWEREVRFAVALDKRLQQVLKVSPPGTAGELIDDETKAEVVRHMTTTPGTLALGFHGCFSPFRWRVFAHLFEGGVVVHAAGEHSAKDGAHALFAAHKAIPDGHPALFAPDGRFGKESGAITILGARRAVADGAPFVAHSTMCPVVWFETIRADDGFTVGLTDGPRAHEGESFAAYRERFYRFYAAQIEVALTGDPRNLTESWTETFRAMLAGGADTRRRSSREG